MYHDHYGGGIAYDYGILPGLEVPSSLEDVFEISDWLEGYELAIAYSLATSQQEIDSILGLVDLSKGEYEAIKALQLSAQSTRATSLDGSSYLPTVRQSFREHSRRSHTKTRNSVSIGALLGSHVPTETSKASSSSQSYPSVEEIILLQELLTQWANDRDAEDAILGGIELSRQGQEPASGFMYTTLWYPYTKDSRVTMYINGRFVPQKNRKLLKDLVRNKREPNALVR
jgi:hypothetical protein